MPDTPTTSPPDAAASGRLSRAVARLTSSQDEIEAAALRDDARDRGAMTIASAVPAERVVLCGRLRSVALRPRSGVPAVEADLYDGSGRLTLVWLGRRAIRGIQPGRVVTVEGRVTSSADRLMMFNPRYSLRPVAGE